MLKHKPIKDIYTLEKAVNDYMSRHGLTLKYSNRNIDYDYYNVTTTDFTLLEGRIIKKSNGKTTVIFKVDGQRKSLYK